MSDLIDTTEMYLRTIYELEEEGMSPFGRASPSACIKVVRPCRSPLPGWSVTTSCTSWVTVICS